MISYLGKITPKALFYIALGLFAVIVAKPSRIGLLFSGTVEWWRWLIFAALTLALVYSLTAAEDWFRMRKRRKANRR